MKRYVAFLRGMNLGRRRITNDELCAIFTDLGYAHAVAFLASGNVIFDADGGTPAQVAAALEQGLEAALGYDVPTFLRTAKEVRAIASHEAFSAADIEASSGKPQVAMLSRKPTDKVRKAIVAMSSPEDRVAIHGREFYWLPSGSILESDLDLKTIDKAVGPMTMRTRRTLERIAAKHLAD